MTNEVPTGFSEAFDEQLAQRIVMKEKLRAWIAEGGLNVTHLYDSQNPAISDDPSF